MNPQKASYRFLMAALALALFMSVSLPGVLHAYGMDAFCISKMEHKSNPLGGAHDTECDLNNQEVTTVYSSSDLQENDNCDLSFSCACSLAEASGDMETIPLSVKTDVILPASVLDFSPELQAAQVPPAAATTTSLASPPPLFLLNATFLN